ncbi:TPA: G5 domain-containing protein, partial [Streptococcus suis]|nr:G5 domain-containing protein [Streptococcus suis]
MDKKKISTITLLLAGTTLATIQQQNLVSAEEVNSNDVTVAVESISENQNSTSTTTESNSKLVPSSEVTNNESTNLSLDTSVSNESNESVAESTTTEVIPAVEVTEEKVLVDESISTLESFNSEVSRNWADYYSSFKNEAELAKVEKKVVSTQEDVVYSGSSTVQLPYNENYVPNSTEVSKYFVSYLNALRELNGIPKLEIVEDSKYAIVSDFAVDFSNQLASKGKIEHIPESEISTLKNSGIYHTDDYESYINKFSYNKNYLNNPSNDQKVVYSDQELAYQLLLNHFSDYSSTSASTDVTKKYGHRIGLLFSTDKYLPVGVATNEKGDIFTTVIFASDSEDGKRKSNFNKHINTLTSTVYHADGVTVDQPAVMREDTTTNKLYYKDKQIQFLPNITFEYGNKKVESISWIKTADGAEKIKEVVSAGASTKEVIDSKTNSIEVVEVPFNTVIQYDSTLDVNTTQTLQNGINGSVTTVLNYLVEEGKLYSVTKTTSVSPVEKIVIKGTKIVEIASKGDLNPPTVSKPEAKIELKEVAFETVYENDPTLELGKETVVREGQNGSVQVITIGDQVTEIVLTEKVDKLVKRGTLVE